MKAQKEVCLEELITKKINLWLKTLRRENMLDFGSFRYGFTGRKLRAGKNHQYSVTEVPFTNITNFQSEKHFVRGPNLKLINGRKCVTSSKATDDVFELCSCRFNRCNILMRMCFAKPINHKNLLLSNSKNLNFLILFSNIGKSRFLQFSARDSYIRTGYCVFLNYLKRHLRFFGSGTVLIRTNTLVSLNSKSAVA